MKSLVCDSCTKPAGDVKLRPGWSQVARREGPTPEPGIWHFCSDRCLWEWVNHKGWEEPLR
jgi:hypothetical protein